jgi:hypothetical protein
MLHILTLSLLERGDKIDKMIILKKTTALRESCIFSRRDKIMIITFKPFARFGNTGDYNDRKQMGCESAKTANATAELQAGCYDRLAAENC